MNMRELIEQNDESAIKKAVDEGLDPNGRDETLLPWLIVALRADAFASLEGLLRAGARPEGPEGDPLSPLMVAIKMGKLAAVDLLLRHGANPNRLLPQKRTALHLATSGLQALSLVERLLAADADPKVVDEQGWTPLMKAAHEGQTQVVECLLKAGSDKTVAEPKSAKTAYDLAKAAGHNAVCEVLGPPSPAPKPAPRMAQPTLPAPTPPKPTPPPKSRRPALLEQIDSEPVKPWQAAIVIFIGLVIATLMYFKLMAMNADM